MNGLWVRRNSNFLKFRSKSKVLQVSDSGRPNFGLFENLTYVRSIDKVPNLGKPSCVEFCDKQNPDFQKSLASSPKVLKSLTSSPKVLKSLTSSPKVL